MATIPHTDITTTFNKKTTKEITNFGTVGSFITIKAGTYEVAKEILIKSNIHLKINAELFLN